MNHSSSASQSSKESFNSCFKAVVPTRVSTQDVAIDHCKTCNYVSFKRLVRIGSGTKWYCMKCFPRLRPTLRDLSTQQKKGLRYEGCSRSSDETSPDHRLDSPRESAV